MYNVVFFINKKGLSKLEYLFLNYYWIITFGGLFFLATGLVVLDNTLIPLMVYPLVLRGKVHHGSIMDLLWWVCFLWIPITWLSNTYNNQGTLILYCLMEQITYMLSYWIVRKNSKISVDLLIQSSYLPVLITAILGIIFMFYEPSWYVKHTADYVTDFEEFQAKRLRSIFSDGYIILYYCGIVMVYELFVVAKGEHKITVKKCKNWVVNLLPSNATMHFILLMVCFVTLLLGMQRAAIVAVILAVFMAFYYAFKYASLKNLKGILLSIGIIAVFCIAAIGMLGEVQADYYTRTVENMIEGSSDLAQERLTHNKSQKSYDLWGDGTGRHNMYADKINPGTSMRDGEYNKLLTEQGYIGAALAGLFFLVAILKCLKNYKYLSFELAMLAFLAISMIGANTLSAYDKHPIVFWMIFGQIANFSKHERDKVIYNYSNV